MNTETALPTGLAPNAREYRRRLNKQSDAQIDAWAKELMRDLSIRRGVRYVIRGFMRTAGIDERALERVFSAGGGPIATLSRTEKGEFMVPAVQLFFLVPGIRAATSNGRERLIAYLVSEFHELAFI